LMVFSAMVSRRVYGDAPAGAVAGRVSRDDTI
jgi:hypothetical protein